MDSITHLFYGAVIAAAIAPARHRRAALLAGAALNTLPDLDVVPLAFCDDPVVQLTWHRSATHSWLVLPFVAWAIWAFFRARGGRVAEAPARWWWAIFACLMAHPFLDAFTVYGTQLLWPLPARPALWSSLFIIDPMFTLPWFAACVVAWRARERIGTRALAAGLVLGTAYLGWSLAAKAMVERAASPALAAIGYAGAPRFSVPAPLTTRRWRVVAMGTDGYVEGERRIGDAGPMAFRFHPSDTAAMRAAADVPALRRLAWWNHGFQKAEVRDGVLVLSDLRMGSEPDFSFAYAVARREGGAWRAIAPPYNVARAQTRKALGMLFRRLLRGEKVKVKFGAQPQAAAGSSGGTPATSASK
ncbi:MAG: metal-dependent hydrolase [Luteimonas sp.]